MIKVKFIKQSDNYVGLECIGHAGYKEHGEDIVCSAVSSITQSLALGILNVLNISAKYKIEEKRGYLELRLPDIKDESVLEKAQVLFKTALLSLEDFQKGYPSNIKVEVKVL